MTNQLPLEVRFMKRYARQLHAAGVPAHQFERMMTSLADKLEFNCEVLSSPTAIFLSFIYKDDEEDDRPIPMQLVRMNPPSINLGNTSELYRLGNEMFDDKISLEEAYVELRDWQSEQLYPLWLQILCWGLTGGAVAVMLSTSWAGIAIAAITCALLGVLVTQAGESLREGGLEATAALLSTFTVYAFNSMIPGLNVLVIIMSSLIVLIPGLGLTVAVTELSTDHLASGSARFAGAMVTLLKLGLGVLIGTVVVNWIGWTVDFDPTASLPSPPDWFRWPALLAAAFSFGVLFSVRRKGFSHCHAGSHCKLRCQSNWCCAGWAGIWCIIGLSNHRDSGQPLWPLSKITGSPDPCTWHHTAGARHNWLSRCDSIISGKWC